MTPGILLHYDGSSWSVMNAGSDVSLYSIWGSSGADVYAAGSGTILHYDGSSWSVSRDAGKSGFNVWGIWGSSAHDIFTGGSRILHYSDGSAADNCTPDNVTCELKVIPSKIHKMLSIASPIHGFVLIGGANTDFANSDKPNWGTDAIKTLASLRVSQRALIALTYIHPFQLDADQYEVTVGNCTGTIEVKPL
jgi:hypothetical protein